MALRKMPKKWRQNVLPMCAELRSRPACPATCLTACILRRLPLAQMQADMVAAVSHEFRTPLTSLRQVPDALNEGRVQDEQWKQAYYQALARATERLHRLVGGRFRRDRVGGHAGLDGAQ